LKKYTRRYNDFEPQNYVRIKDISIHVKNIKRVMKGAKYEKIHC